MFRNFINYIFKNQFNELTKIINNNNKEILRNFNLYAEEINKINNRIKKAEDYYNNAATLSNDNIKGFNNINELHTNQIYNLETRLRYLEQIIIEMK